MNIEEIIRSVRSATAIFAAAVIDARVVAGTPAHADYLNACDAVERFANSLRLAQKD